MRSVSAWFGSFRSTDSAPVTSRSGVPLWVARTVLVLMGLLAIPAILPSIATVEAQSAPYEIEIGDVTVLPDTLRIVVPVFVTNAEPISEWNMGLDYDDLLLNVIDATVVGTESEPLNPAIIIAGTPGSNDITLIYPTPFPAGEHQRALWLELEILDPNAIPVGGSLVELLSIETESSDPTMELANGGTVIPDAINGSVQFYAPPVLRVGRVTATPFDGEVLVPVEAWTAGPADTLEMGLDYDDLLLCEFTLAGSDLEAIVGTGVTATVSSVPGVPTQVLLDAQPGSVIPALNGETIGYLVYQVGSPGLSWLDLFSGSFPIELVDGTAYVDTTQITNLLPGQLTVQPQFVRGDVDFNGSVNAADIILILGHLFPPATTAIPCLDAGDVNDDGALNITDATSLIGYVFNVGPAPPQIPAPFPAPGLDPTVKDDGLDCLGD